MNYTPSLHIGIVNWSLLETRGGIERVGCDLASAMLEKGHRVTLFCQARKGGKPQYPLPEGAELVPLPLGYSAQDLEPARQALLKQRPDVLAAVFSWESLLWFPALLKDTGIPLLISEHSHPELINRKWNAYERSACLDAADHIHILLEQFRPLYTPEQQTRISVIPNAVELTEMDRPRSGADAARCGADAARSGADTATGFPRLAPRRLLLGAGRFVEPTKQFPLLIKAFALLAPEFPDWDLRICGAGDALAEYRRLVAGLGLEDRVCFPGMIREMAAEYAAADVFCIPSRHEGFGKVTTEAQLFALPVVGFAACSGTNAIIVPGENGLLAEEMTETCLARHLALLMRDPALRRRLGERGKSMLDRYDPLRVYTAWEEMLRATAAGAGEGGTRLQRLERETDPEHPLREILERKHPFDRSRYLALHKACLAQNRPSPFSEREVAGFAKKQRRFGFSGAGRVLRLLRQALRCG